MSIPSRIPSIFKKTLDEPVSGLERVQNGAVNLIYIVTTAQSKYIILIDPNESTSARFQKEEWCMKQMQGKGIPTTSTLSVGTAEDNPFMILPYIDGVDGTEADAERLTIWRKLGEYAHKINGVATSGFGENMTAPGVFRDGWDRFIDYNISSLLEKDPLVEKSLITAEQSRELHKIFVYLKNTPFQFGLIHHDLALKNTRVSPDGTVYLLDWGSAAVNIFPHLDIAEILESSLQEESDEFESFLQGYGLGKKKYRDMKQDIQFLKLLTYIDNVRWAVDRKPDLIKKKTEKFNNAFHKTDI